MHLMDTIRFEWKWTKASVEAYEIEHGEKPPTPSKSYKVGELPEDFRRLLIPTRTPENVVVFLDTKKVFEIGEQHSILSEFRDDCYEKTVASMIHFAGKRETDIAEFLVKGVPDMARMLHRDMLEIPHSSRWLRPEIDEHFESLKKIAEENRAAAKAKEDTRIEKIDTKRAADLAFFEDERDRWIEAHGSPELKYARGQDLDIRILYLREWMEKEYGAGWRLALTDGSAGYAAEAPTRGHIAAAMAAEEEGIETEMHMTCEDDEYGDESETPVLVAVVPRGQDNSCDLPTWEYAVKEI